MMSKLLRLKPLWVFSIFAFLDLICIGMGMGVPIFCILFGFLVGWFMVRYITTTMTSTPQVFRRVLLYAIITAAVTLLGMIVIWVPSIPMLFNPAQDLATSGIPMILYEPRASFIGWMVLMILISPFLQLLTTVFAGLLALAVGLGPQDPA